MFKVSQSEIIYVPPDLPRNHGNQEKSDLCRLRCSPRVPSLVLLCGLEAGRSGSPTEPLRGSRPRTNPPNPNLPHKVPRRHRDLDLTTENLLLEVSLTGETRSRSGPEVPPSLDKTTGSTSGPLCSTPQTTNFRTSGLRGPDPPTRTLTQPGPDSTTSDSTTVNYGCPDSSERDSGTKEAGKEPVVYVPGPDRDSVRLRLRLRIGLTGSKDRDVCPVINSLSFVGPRSGHGPLPRPPRRPGLRVVRISYEVLTPDRPRRIGVHDVFVIGVQHTLRRHGVDLVVPDPVPGTQGLDTS